MTPRLSRLACLVVVLACVAACGDDSSDNATPNNATTSNNTTRTNNATSSDAGGDAAQDTSADDTGDAAVDAGVDAPGDATADVEPDVSEDAEEDTAEDVPDMPVELVATPDTLVLVEGEQAAWDVLANDRGAGLLSAELLTAPDRFVVEPQPDGTWLVQAPTDFNGAEVLRYRLTDAEGRTGETTASVTAYREVTQGAPQVIVPRRGVRPREVMVVVNTDLEFSSSVADYYMEQRGIPAENRVEIALGTSDVITPDAFAPLIDQVLAATPEHIQAFALMWIAPYRVGCQSITTAFATGGFDDAYCNTSGQVCGSTAATTYFNTPTTHPTEQGVRPAMMVAGTSEANARALIDRGVAADGTAPTGTGYMIRTTDEARSVRFGDFAGVEATWTNAGAFDWVHRDNADGQGGGNLLNDSDDVMFYFTGLAQVGGLDTLTFLPGAAADHLTSFGGRLTATSGQMSIIRWLEAGATASFGTTVEPCNYTAKFPQVSVFMDHYYRGNTLVEAYWKSVRWPGEGAFVGEPLASPWGRSDLAFDGETLTLSTTWLRPGLSYTLEAANTPDGPFEPIQDIRTTQYGTTDITVAGPFRLYYRLVATP